LPICSYFTFANGGYIIRISPIKGILVVPLERIDEIAAGRKKFPIAMARDIQRVK
jgi:hypothetical protein